MDECLVVVLKSVCSQFTSLNEQFHLSDVGNKASIINLFILLHSKHASYNAASFHNSLPVHKSQACHQTFKQSFSTKMLSLISVTRKVLDL